MVGQTISHYRIVQRIGGGGMGVVYKAEDTKLHRFVALKFLPDGVAGDSQALGRLEREAQAASALNHPNICTIYEIDEANGHAFIAMELLEGRSLDAEPHGQAMAIEKLLGIGIQLAAGLEAAHSKGIIHRDIKPANLFLANQGQLKILDFGLAKLASSDADEAGGAETVAATRAATGPENLTSPGSAVGTIAYMSPEQAQGENIDARSDLFSAGSVLYELATGTRPFRGRTSAIIFEAILNREPGPARELNPSLPVELGRIIEKCLEKHRDVRYQHAADLGADLKRLKRDTTSGKQRKFGEQEDKSGVEVAADSVASSAAGPDAGSSSAILAAAKQHRFGTGAAVVVILGLVAAAAYGVYQIARQPKRVPFENYTVSQVTDFGDVENTAISPDGKYLAFVRGRTGRARSLWLRQLSTSSDTQVLSSIEPVLSLGFSPDQSYLFYRITEAERFTTRDLYRVPILGGKPQIVVQDIDADVSFVNGGRQLCFVRGVEQPLSYSIILRDSKTGAEQVLFHSPGLMPYPVICSPDGKTAMLSFGRSLDASENDLSVTSLPNGKPRVLVKLGSEGWAVFSMAWLPNQEGVILTEDMEPSWRRAQLVQVTYPDGKQRRITNDLNDYRSVGISSDGKMLSALKVQTARSFCIWSAGQAENAKIVESVKDPVFFLWRDQEKILFNTSGMDLKMADLTTGETTSVSADQTRRYWHPSLCGHDEVVASGTGDDGSFGIWKLNLTTGAYKQFTSGFHDVSPHCTIDGKWIVYFDSVDSKLMRVPADGGTPVEISGPGFGALDISPDGTRIVGLNSAEGYVDGKPKSVIHLVGTNDWKEMATVNVGIMNTDNQRVRFMPDGKGAVFDAVVNGKRNLWVMPFDGGPARQLTNFDGDDFINDFHWSPDGKKLGIVRWKQSADAVLFRDAEK
jgi:eukaryotic-like serine/threonine-protein kinase